MDEITPAGPGLVMAVISSVNGGYSALNPDIRLGVEVVDETHLTYSLTSDTTGEQHLYTVTLAAA